MKGQASFEFMILILVMFMISIISFSAFYGVLGPADSGSALTLNGICAELGQKIDSALFFGAGFSQNISLPKKVSGASYTVSIKNSTIICKDSKNSFAENFFAAYVSNGTAKEFFLPLREIEIKNIEGEISIL